MFDKILIANRGEIACRVIRTARRMGIKTVAVYSEADADAVHVRMADEAVPIGPAPSAQSYLVIDRIVEACRATGAQAVHPGYGFLSENPRFCAALEAAGIAFIGPGVHAIEAMGDKIESKKLAQAAGVSTVPGHLAPILDEDEAVAVSRRIGYPVMIKASAGGGGKGMRVAGNDDEAREGFRSARNEARTAFGDDRVFAEKFIEEPRHIEIQVLADSHGNTVYLGERECSIQRRHQKVIEEAPSPFLDEATRRAMGAEACTLARAVGYRSAGTVEFIVGADRSFYFLEMNTRLQVEHPVTEAVTGLDLVELMIRIAAGEELPFRQEDIRLEGWAVEARVYAEDPLRGFLPSIGRLTRYRAPEEGPQVRVDTGVDEGGEISMHYDPMIAKLIGIGTNRNAAIAAIRNALDGFVIRGVNHNIPFLAALMHHPRFVEGRLTTRFIAEEFPDGFHGTAPAGDAADRVAALGAALLHRQATLRGTAAGAQDWVLRADRQNRPVTVREDADGWRVTLAGRSFAIHGLWRPGEMLFDGMVDGVRMVAQIDRRPVGLRLTHAGGEVDLALLTPRAAALAELMPVKAPPDMSRFLLSPMPGLLVSVAVAAGDPVRAGQELAVVEAMKMENILRAERDGVVGTLHAKPGDSLAVDQKILEFAAA
ncbi:MAG: acetyl/propionyl/methylcrotonyl-CoA carboxylase subunit alpha [Inquilinus limosus]|uniref:propionyl-CoA carboxylase n=1 Tax=Inquilinus limosus TaxID=171674 RepID=A0A952KEF4_9PROT|nr:acetyl/propionyl/methylcrotonyl-CoA carboxylase subunit alpha [Inquilinus limosus]